MFLGRIPSASLGLVLCVATGAAAGDKPCVAATMRDLSTVWLGGTLGQYFRLQLKPDGTGLLTTQWMIGKPARAYEVTGTTLANRRVSFSLHSLDNRDESLYLRGTACRGLLDLQIGSNSPKFNIHVVLETEGQLNERLQAVTKRAEEHERRRLSSPETAQGYACAFPGTGTCVSPGGQWSVEWREPRGDGRHELLLTSLRTGQTKRFFQFGRSVHLLWSPGARAVAISDRAGSSETALWIASGPTLTDLINVEDRLRASVGALPEIYANGHRYFEPVRWLGPDELLFRVRAFDGDAGKEFNGLFRYQLTGRVQREGQQ